MDSLILCERRYNDCMNSPILKIIDDLADIPAAEWGAAAGDAGCG